MTAQSRVLPATGSAFGHGTAVVCGALIGSATLVSMVTQLAQRGVFGHGAAPILALVLLFVCPLTALCAWRLEVGVGRVNQMWVPLIAVVMVLLIEIGVLGRVALGTDGRVAIGIQELAVAGAVLLAFGAAAFAARWRGLAAGQRAAVGVVVVFVALVALCLFARPGDRALIPGAAYPRDWPEPFVDVALISLIAWLASRVTPPWIVERGGRFGRPLNRVRGLLGPMIVLLYFAFSRDPACVALLVGVVAASSVLESREGFAHLRRRRLEVSAFSVLGLIGIAAEGQVTHVPGFTLRTVFGGASGDWSSPHALALSWIGPVHVADVVRIAVPANVLDVRLMGVGLAVLFAALGGLLILVARRITSVLPAATAMGISAFVAVQCLAWMLAAFRLPCFGLGAPLVTGSVPWDTADVIAIGVVAGLAARGRRVMEKENANVGR